MVLELEEFRDSMLEKEFGVAILGTKHGADGTESGWKTNEELVQHLNSGKRMPYIKEVLNNSLERVGIGSDASGRRVQKGIESFTKSKSVRRRVLDIVCTKCCPCCTTALLRFNVTDNVT